MVATVFTVASTGLPLRTMARYNKQPAIRCAACRRRVGAPLLSAFDIYGAAYATIAGIGVQGLCLLGFLLAKCRKQFG
ncbi:MAG: hypothetical protein V8T36_06880 [Ruthenibacterium lactatiformans]